MKHISCLRSCGASNTYRPGEALWSLFGAQCLPVSSRARTSLRTSRPTTGHHFSSSTCISQESGSNSLNSHSRNQKDDHQLKDIVLNDLDATLESHRTSNRASIPQSEATAGLPDGEHGENNSGADGSDATTRIREVGGRSSRARRRNNKFLQPDPRGAESNIVRSAQAIHNTLPEYIRKHENEMTEKAKAGRNAEKEREALESGHVSHLTEKQIRAASVQHTQNLHGKVKKIAARKAIRSDAPKVLEYEGLNVRPSRTPLLLSEKELRALPEHPWLERMETQHGDTSLERLSAEVQAFHEWMLPTQAEKAGRQAALDDVFSIIHDHLPGHTTEVFGSERTGLSVATSDIDVRIQGPGGIGDRIGFKAPRHAVRKSLNKDLESVYKAVQNSGKYILVNLRHARYPLVHCHHKAAGLDMQIVCSNDTAPARAYMHTALSSYPSLHPIYTTARTMLDARGLMDVFRGGIGSYQLFMMVLASLRLPYSNKKTERNEEHKTVDPSARGANLLHFLRTFANLDTYNQGIAIEPTPQVFDKHIPTKQLPKSVIAALEADPILDGQWRLGIIDAAQPYLLVLQDPNDPLNDLGRKTFGFKHVQATFKATLKEVESLMKRNAEGSLLAPLVGTSARLFHSRRVKLADYGERVLARGKERVEEVVPGQAGEETSIAEIGQAADDVSEMNEELERKEAASM